MSEVINLAERRVRQGKLVQMSPAVANLNGFASDVAKLPGVAIERNERNPRYLSVTVPSFDRQEEMAGRVLFLAAVTHAEMAIVQPVLVKHELDGSLTFFFEATR